MKLLIFATITLMIININTGPIYPMYPLHSSYRIFDLDPDVETAFSAFLPLEFQSMLIQDPHIKNHAQQLSPFLEPFSKNKKPLYEAFKAGTLPKDQDIYTSTAFAAHMEMEETPDYSRKDYKSQFEDDYNGEIHGGNTHMNPTGQLESNTW